MPKVKQAIFLWVQFPRAIASDLSRFHNRRISDWHRGRRDEYGELLLSSYEMLELLSQLPSESALKTALRGGEWSEEEAMRALIANEMSSVRAILQVVHGGREAAKPPKVFRSLSERKELEEVDEEVEEARDAVFELADFSAKYAPIEIENEFTPLEEGN